MSEPGHKPGMSLHQAAALGNWRSLRDVLARGADPDSMDDDGRTALHVAAGGGHAVCVAALLARGAHPDSTDDDGRTALHVAAGGGHVNCVKRLLALGADHSHVDDDGRTALHVAAGGGHAGCVAALTSAETGPHESEIVTATDQKELDEALERQRETPSMGIKIAGEPPATMSMSSGSVVTRGYWLNTKLKVSGNARVVARDESHIRASGDAVVDARDHCKVKARGRAKVTCFDQPAISARGNVHVRIDDGARRPEIKASTTVAVSGREDQVASVHWRKSWRRWLVILLSALAVALLWRHLVSPYSLSQNEMSIVASDGIGMGLTWLLVLAVADGIILGRRSAQTRTRRVAYALSGLPAFAVLALSLPVAFSIWGAMMVPRHEEWAQATEVFRRASVPWPDDRLGPPFIRDTWPTGRSHWTAEEHRQYEVCAVEINAMSLPKPWRCLEIDLRKPPLQQVRSGYRLVTLGDSRNVTGVAEDYDLENGVIWDERDCFSVDSEGISSGVSCP